MFYGAQLFEGLLVLIPDYFFFCSKAFVGLFSLLFLWASNYQLVDKMNYTEFTFSALTSEFKFCTKPGFS